LARGGEGREGGRDGARHGTKPLWILG